MLYYLFIFCLALGAACGGSGNNNEDEAGADTTAREEGIEQKELKQEIPQGEQASIRKNPDTLYLLSGTEPFWSLVVAKPKIIFHSIGGDTLLFDYQEPRQAAARPADYVQVYDLGEEQQLVLRKTENCPCSDGMSSKEYPYDATMILKNKVLEGCGRTP